MEENNVEEKIENIAEEIQISEDEKNEQISIGSPRYPYQIEEEILYYPNNVNVLRIGDTAPEFSAVTTFGRCNLSDYRGRWLVLFSHPGDFTPVCTTEFMCFAKYYPRFKERNCELLGLSIDNINSHLAWVHDIYKNTGIEIPFPVISDKDATIANMYNMMSPNMSTTYTVRDVYIICPQGKIRAILTYPATTGRNIGEILRIVEALQTTDNENVATPANWMPKMPTVAFSPSTYQELVERIKDNSSCLNWYLCFNNSGFQNLTVSDFSCNDILGQKNEDIQKCKIDSLNEF